MAILKDIYNDNIEHTINVQKAIWGQFSFSSRLACPLPDDFDRLLNKSGVHCIQFCRLSFTVELFNCNQKMLYDKLSQPIHIKFITVDTSI